MWQISGRKAPIGGAVIAVLAALLAGVPAGELATQTAGAAPAEAAGAAGAAEVAPPPAPLPTAAGVDYQLGGNYRPPRGVTVVVRDSTAAPAGGRYSICYVNGFQTQPGTKRFWLDNHPALILRKDDGTPLRDPNWPDELLLDTSTSTNRERLAEIIGAVIIDCAVAGFSAVEFDNLDSYSRSRGALTEQNNLYLAQLLVSTAHLQGLAAGQKNSPELGTSGRDVAGFDFAISEECHRWRECRAYTNVYGASVINIEYAGRLRAKFSRVCASAATPEMTILRDINLVTPTKASYVYKRC